VTFALDEPPDGGIITFEMPVRPVSVQSSREARKAMVDTVSKFVEPCAFLLTGELEIRIEWTLHERERYEGVHSPDIDNILKPLLDAISGPRGILVNDCQVQSVRCHWIDWTISDQKLAFEIRYLDDEWIGKADLLWVEYERKLCMPLNTNLPAKIQLDMINCWDTMLSGSRKMEALAGSYEAGRRLLPLQRPFHRARLREFSKTTYDVLRDELKQLTSSS